MVAAFLINECKRQGKKPTIRRFIDKAISDFRQHSMKASELHWKDLVKSNLKQQCVALSQPLTDLNRKEKKEAEQRIVLEIVQTFDETTDRVAAWKDRTGKSKAAMYRRIAELKSDGRA